MTSIKAIVTKAGLDAHERGVHVVSRGLRDAGFEVVLLGLRTSPQTVAKVAVQEDCNVVGVSSLAGGHLNYAKKLREALDAEGVDPVVVFGGVIPDEDNAALQALGVQAIFQAGSMVTDMAEQIRELCNARDAGVHVDTEGTNG
ncbi:cobalamin B12-binding domain-containing protein [Actinomadura alba]|uniref:Cobalamin B12-binding domain-containing protein n=1 Tax=Actinomadura alba TaxID=406431 RepID=A0ABR7LTA6_9ACTN|nr:cobalamin-dependent protein [Actinomadura alba]MBC6468083.1 cobalamin B12-binding domain-containing protein [Actinomadura alba]